MTKTEFKKAKYRDSKRRAALTLIALDGKCMETQTVMCYATDFSGKDKNYVPEGWDICPLDCEKGKCRQNTVKKLQAYLKRTEPKETVDASHN